MTSDTLKSPAGALTLQRPGTKDPTLRAWDAADELLLDQAAAWIPEGGQARVLVLDDAFGALTLGLEPYNPMALADAATLVGALTLNAPANGLAVTTPSSWLAPPTGPFDVVVMRIPKQLDYLAWLLRWVNQVLTPDGVVIAGGMIKHLPDRSAELFRELMHSKAVCPARKKARVVICGRGDRELEDWPGYWKGYALQEDDSPVLGLPAVFARERLDIGTRMLLPEVHRVAASLSPGARVLDLACGNGVLGLAALKSQPAIRVLFSDVSSQAVASARHNVEIAQPDADVAFHHGDGIDASAGEFDVILLNPPFHEGGVVGDHIALRLFQQAARHLAKGGQMIMVGNRHLGYHRSLKRYFPAVEQLQADPRFVVFAVRRQPLAAGRP
ncbi:class I SAM-dependent methyltransferase [Marinobacter sp.]|uniref:class I SAM-dependent methyltransferase n=1 Tax=Marinobacter sp. TaxID=50741 RepID=UPI0034A494A2